MNPEQLNTPADWPDDPLQLFGEWFAAAEAADVHEPQTMALATATPDGIPSARMVFLRGWDREGFCFYTNYNSRKGRELTANPHAALVFYWPELYRQIRIEGAVEKLSASASDAYFQSRERSKQISACVSSQSQPIADWRDLQRLSEELAQSPGPLSRPQHWGGYRVRPQALEFWLGRDDRLHRRCRYEQDGKTWARQLQAP